jgi:hypothetical protein
MATRDISRTNFGFLEAHEEQLVPLGMLAERYFPDDPARFRRRGDRSERVRRAMRC